MFFKSFISFVSIAVLSTAVQAGEPDVGKVMINENSMVGKKIYKIENKPFFFKCVEIPKIECINSRSSMDINLESIFLFNETDDKTLSVNRYKYNLSEKPESWNICAAAISKKNWNGEKEKSVKSFVNGVEAKTSLYAVQEEGISQKVYFFTMTPQRAKIGKENVSRKSEITFNYSQTCKTEQY